MFGLGLDKYSPMLGGQFDKEPLNLDDSEHRRKLAAVEVISNAMKNSKSFSFSSSPLPGYFEDHEGPGQEGLVQ